MEIHSILNVVIVIIATTYYVPIEAWVPSSSIIRAEQNGVRSTPMGSSLLTNQWSAQPFGGGSCGITTTRTASKCSMSATSSSTTRIATDEQFVDEEALLAESTFPIPPDVLIEKCKDVIRAQSQLQDVDNFDDSIYSDDFRFCAPFIGGATPTDGEDFGMKKAPFLNSLRSFDLLGAFPNMNNRYHFFRVDPFEPNRVWFQTRVTATHTGDLLGKEPTGRQLELPPQAFSMTFNEGGQVTLFNVGYVIDRTVGNTGGLGGAFGFFYGTGNPLPFPECYPFQPSFQLKALGWVQKLQELLPGQGDNNNDEKK